MLKFASFFFFLNDLKNIRDKMMSPLLKDGRELEVVGVNGITVKPRDTSISIDVQAF